MRKRNLCVLTVISVCGLRQVAIWLAQPAGRRGQRWVWSGPPGGRILQPRGHPLPGTQDRPGLLARDRHHGQPHLLLCRALHHLVGLPRHEQCQHLRGGGDQVMSSSQQQPFPHPAGSLEVRDEVRGSDVATPGAFHASPCVFMAERWFQCTERI